MLLSGDLANMAMDPNAPQAEVEKSHRALDEVAQSFLSISSKVYYIPGNVSSHKGLGDAETRGCHFILPVETFMNGIKIFDRQK